MVAIIFKKTLAVNSRIQKDIDELFRYNNILQKPLNKVKQFDNNNFTHWLFLLSLYPSNNKDVNYKQW